MGRRRNSFIHWTGAVFSTATFILNDDGSYEYPKLGFVMATVKPANDTEEFYAAVGRYAQTPHEAKMSTVLLNAQTETRTNRPILHGHRM